MKNISILIPAYNEEDNIKPICEAIVNQFSEGFLTNYKYTITFIDNASTDNTRSEIKKVASKNKNVRAIFNAKNFGQFKSPYYGLLQTDGDCTILLCCDFQDPIELIPQMVQEWENGHQVVVMQKTASKENKLVRFFRTIYYKLIKKFSDVEQIEHFTGFALYDKSFIDVLRKLNDPKPFLRGIVAEFASNVKIIEYTQQKRRAGKTKNNFASLYDAAMISFTSYTKVGLRIATFLGFFVALVALVFGIVYLVLKILYWDTFVAGMSPVLLGMFFLGAVVLVFLGVMGEYIMSINDRVINRPLVIEEERINFDED